MDDPNAEVLGQEEGTITSNATRNSEEHSRIKKNN